MKMAIVRTILDSPARYKVYEPMSMSVRCLLTLGRHVRDKSTQRRHEVTELFFNARADRGEMQCTKRMRHITANCVSAFRCRCAWKE